MNKKEQLQELKIFELKCGGERIWVSGYTNIHALKVICSHESSDISDYEESDEIIEVPKDKWPEMTIRNSDYNSNDPEDWETKTFEEYMKDQKIPDIIATTLT